MLRTFVMWLGLTLGAGSLWAPTVASMEALEADAQWHEAQGFARQYRLALRADSVRLTDSLAFQIVRIADHYGMARVAFGLVWTESPFKVDARRRLLRPPPRALPYPCLPRALQRPPRHLVLGPRGAELR